MIGHQAVGSDSDPGLGLDFRKDLFKRSLVCGFLKQRQAANTAIQHMIGKISSS